MGAVFRKLSTVPTVISDTIRAVRGASVVAALPDILFMQFLPEFSIEQGVAFPPDWL